MSKLGHNLWVNFIILAWRGGTPMRLCCWRDDLEKWKLLISGSFTGVEDCDFDEVWGNCGGGWFAGLGVEDLWCWILEMTATLRSGRVWSDGCWRRGEIEPLMLTVELVGRWRLYGGCNGCVVALGGASSTCWRKRQRCDGVNWGSGCEIRLVLVQAATGCFDLLWVDSGGRGWHWWWLLVYSWMMSGGLLWF
jgi:hypothetical protein